MNKRNDSKVWKTENLKIGALEIWKSEPLKILLFESL